MNLNQDNPLDTTDAGRRLLQSFEELVRQQKVQNEENQQLRSENQELRSQFQELNRRLSQIETDDAAGESKLNALAESSMQAEKFLNNSLTSFLQQITKMRTEADARVQQAQSELVASKQQHADEMKLLIESLRSSFQKYQQALVQRIETLEKRMEEQEKQMAGLWSESLQFEKALQDLIKRFNEVSTTEATEYANAQIFDNKLIESVEKLHKSILRLTDKTK